MPLETEGLLHLDIRWETHWSARTTPKVTLSYSNDAGIDWVPIAEGLPVSGSLMWNADQVRGQSILIRAVAVDDRGTAIDTDRFTCAPGDMLQMPPFSP